ncbi:hypothetical protein D9757_011798 [Collybiopsis confluens]|uniref:Uncharacterized protein n=1 Tax=Collybiopsis confluens TaxID=2823264 RepID=A0A8H5H0W4_9AGAR|nr:hypothetical protein D9757_011798 [Collybiopsis confluens]
MMLELVTWPDFSYSDKPEDTSYILPTRAANFSELQFTLVGKKYSHLPQFRAREREQDVLKILRVLGLEMKDPKFITVFKHEHAISQVPAFPVGFRHPGLHAINRGVTQSSDVKVTA